MGALSPFPEKLNPGADKTPGLGILVNTQIGQSNVSYHHLHAPSRAA